MVEMSFFEKAVNAAIVSVISVVLGWLLSSFRTAERLKEFEKEVVAPLRERVSKFEGAASTYVTREELDRTVNGLRADMKDWIGDVKAALVRLEGKIDNIHS